MVFESQGAWTKVGIGEEAAFCRLRTASDFAIALALWRARPLSLARQIDQEAKGDPS